MRTGRPIGLSQDGRSLIIATSGGEELAVPVDDQFHAALRGDRPRLGQLEMQMEDALGPRDIQARIRSGHTLEEVVRVAGLPYDRVERFAAPVLAERQHVATLAMSSSVRRRGETSGHRNLRLAVTEKLVARGIDIDTVDWDSYRMDDGRWSVSASYRSGEAQRTAVFVFDLRGRFSVAQNDEARWAVGEQSSSRGPMPGRRRPGAADGEDPDVEPTLDLSDELALVRVVQAAASLEPVADLDEEQPAEISDEQSDGGDPDDETGDEPEGRLAEVRDLYPVPDRDDDTSGPYEDTGPADGSGSTDDTDQQGPVGVTGSSHETAETAETAKNEENEGEPVADGEQQAAAEPVATLDSRRGPFSRTRVEEESSAEELESRYPTRHEGAAGDSAAGGDSAPSSGGLSDASAVPETADWGWDPGMVVDFPVEPSPDVTADEDDTQEQAEVEARVDVRDEPAPEVDPTRDPVTETVPAATTGPQTSPEVPVAEVPVAEVAATDTSGPGLVAPEETAPEVSPGEVPAHPAALGVPEEPADAEPPARQPGKRKRAAVPSWDEIMFGGPKRSG